MFYFVSCLIGFSVILGICFSLFFIEPEILLEDGSKDKFKKSKLFDDYLKTERLFSKGRLSKQEWLEKRRVFLAEYKRLVL